MGFPFPTVLDANLNRAREGLRVLEEVARFVLKNRRLMRRCQRLRYDLSKAEASFSRRKLFLSRDSQRDVGRPSQRWVPQRHRKIRDLVCTNGKRVEEALRVLEEFARFKDVQVSKRFASLRFRVYTLEADLLSRL